MCICVFRFSFSSLFSALCSCFLLFFLFVVVLLAPCCQDVCSGRSGHAEVVMVEYDPLVVTYEELLDVFWKSHDPTQVATTVVSAVSSEYGSKSYYYNSITQAYCQACTINGLVDK